MTSGPIFSDAQLKLWLRRVKTEVSKGTAPEATLDLVKAAMTAQAVEQSQQSLEIDAPQKSAKTS